MNTLATLWDSTKKFHERFKKFPPDQTAAFMVFREEIREVEQAFNYETDNELCEEIADVIVTAMGLMMSRGIGYDVLESAIIRTAHKNDSKDHNTHVVDEITGKIRRINKY